MYAVDLAINLRIIVPAARDALSAEAAALEALADDAMAGCIRLDLYPLMPGYWPTITYAAARPMLAAPRRRQARRAGRGHAQEPGGATATKGAAGATHAARTLAARSAGAARPGTRARQSRGATPAGTPAPA